MTVRAFDQMIQGLEPRLLLAASPDGFVPSEILHAYGFDQVSFAGKRGRRIAADGRGQTIAIVTAYRAPSVVNDLKVFDKTFGLPDTDLTGAPILSQYAMQDSRGRYPRVDVDWSGEAAMDIEWAHAVAPRANILHVQAISDDIEDLMDAVDYARQQPGVTVVSMSWGTEEFHGQSDYDVYLGTPKRHIGAAGARGGVTFVASAGDDGAGATWPSTSPNVIAVGGTSLTIDSADDWSSEVAWASSGGGVSRIDGSHAPDVAYNANPLTGFSVYDTSAHEGWYTVAGTSAGAPQWGGLIALVNQGRSIRGLGSLDSASTLDGIYKLPAADYHDIVVGSNGHPAKVGYDLVTGRGTPVASGVINDLIPYGTKTFGRVLAAAAAERKPAGFAASPFFARAPVTTLTGSPTTASAATAASSVLTALSRRDDSVFSVTEIN